MSKVKKSMVLYPHEMDIGDEVEGYGKIVYINRKVAVCDYEFAYIDVEGCMGVFVLADDYSMEVVREVEKPDEVEIDSANGETVRIVDYIENEVLIWWGPPSTIVKADSLIQAVKDVKGLD